jgi:hypothetical protein
MQTIVSLKISVNVYQLTTLKNEDLIIINSPKFPDQLWSPFSGGSGLFPRGCSDWDRKLITHRHLPPSLPNRGTMPGTSIPLTSLPGLLRAIFIFGITTR